MAVGLVGAVVAVGRAVVGVDVKITVGNDEGSAGRLSNGRNS